MGKDKIKVHVRWMIRRDMPEVLEIEKQSFAHQWGEEEFLTVLRKRNCIGMVAEREDRVLGYMVYELRKTQITILSFATHPDFRNREVATAMAEKIKAKLSTNRRKIAEITIRETSLGGLLFFKKMGFLAKELIRNHFDDSGEDGVRMIYEVEQEEVFKADTHKPVNRVFRQTSGDIPPY